MPCKDFSIEDVVCICQQIAKDDNIIVQLPAPRKSIFRRQSEADISSPQRKSSIARKISLGNGIPLDIATSNENPYSPTIPRKISAPPTIYDESRLYYQKERVKKTIPGLGGRDVVAVAILVDDNGSPMKTYTEHEHIPEEAIEKAGRIFLSRIPMAPEKDDSIVNKNILDPTIHRPLKDVFIKMDPKVKEKLYKKMEKVLMKLHTCDLNTALSFLKTDRYNNAKIDIKSEMIAFVTKDLKMTVVTINS